MAHIEIVAENQRAASSLDMLLEYESIVRLQAKREAIDDFTRIFLMCEPDDAQADIFRRAHGIWLRMAGRQAGIDASTLVAN